MSAETQHAAEIMEEIRRFVSVELLEESEPVGDDENLLADGMVDSLGMLRLVAHIDEEFGVKIPPEHFTIENFRSLNAMEAYLSTKAST